MEHTKLTKVLRDYSFYKTHVDYYHLYPNKATRSVCNLAGAPPGGQTVSQKENFWTVLTLDPLHGVISYRQ